MKAIGLFSGGLDSMLAVRSVEEQGIRVEAVAFTSPFFGAKEALMKQAKDNSINLKIMSMDKEFLRMVRQPKHGRGRHLNPCIDCKILMLRQAKKVARKTGARFIFTGEVLDQRPMSQRGPALKVIEKEAGLHGKLLRPLSARLLKETEAEKKGWIDREKLHKICGRSRKKQIQLAKKYKLKGYSTPAGGCLLTQKEYARRIHDLILNRPRAPPADFHLLRYGRHFRKGRNKIIVGRNEQENKALAGPRAEKDYEFEVKGHGSPVTILQGPKTKEAVRLAAELTARYSDAKGIVEVSYEGKKITVSPRSYPDLLI
ncbi:DUF814 domain-containing protein [Candidatus Woesearchaeota archaeon]|nr:DUF814 domain-containing protein [Candidatus Woesearchaeota archaeon]